MDKKAAKVLRPAITLPTKRDGINGFLPINGSPPIIPFPFGSALCPQLLSAFFFSIFSFEKILWEGVWKKRDRYK
ncbi:hypothetical protein [Pedobacter agri]|uniref:hypothetical protein n=1 Tax=Pedobacter agri TaxID=454586 RepID=UPI00292DC433|nr:hypothetical protein [Pedobacter agri]